jgi:MFS family permease
MPDTESPHHRTHGWLFARIRALAHVVRAEPAFVRFTTRELVFMSGVLLVVPLVPLYYVNAVGAPDAWIGAIASSQTMAMLAGYYVWRRRSAKVGGRAVMLIALPCAALFPAVLSIVHQLPLVVLVAGLGGFFTAGVDLVLFDELMRTVPRRSAVALASVHATGINGLSIVAPILGASLAAVIGIEAGLRVGTVLSLAGFGLFALEAHRKTRAVPA